MKRADLEGKKIAITGVLSRPRKEIQADIKRMGGIPSSGVNRATDYLVVGAKVGGVKINNALELGVRLISEEELSLLFQSEDEVV